MRSRISQFLLLPLLLLAGCASGGSEPAAPNGRVTFDAGSGSGSDIAEKVTRVLTRSQYEIYRREPEPNIYFETYWRERYPLPDEEAQGLGEAKTRILIRARMRQRTRSGDLYGVSLIAENLTRGKGGEWAPTPPSDDFKQYVKKLADEIKAELDAGIRVF